MTIIVVYMLMLYCLEGLSLQLVFKPVELHNIGKLELHVDLEVIKLVSNDKFILMPS